MECRSKYVALALMIVLFCLAAWHTHYGTPEFRKNPDWKQLITSFSEYDSNACGIYFEFGGVLSRRPGLTFLDGQKAVCFDSGLQPNPGGCIVYSFGSNGEWSFDEQMELFGCKVYCFDPSVRYQNHHHSANVLFYRIGISDAVTELDPHGWRMTTLPELRKRLGHVGVVIDYLKMDIEGAEWPILRRWIAEGDLLKVKQLAVEIHLEEPDSIPGKHEVIRQLEASGFVRFFARQNPWSDGVYLDKFNVSSPSCYELAWYNSRYLD